MEVDSPPSESSCGRGRGKGRVGLPAPRPAVGGGESRGGDSPPLLGMEVDEAEVSSVVLGGVPARVAAEEVQGATEARRVEEAQQVEQVGAVLQQEQGVTGLEACHVLIPEMAMEVGEGTSGELDAPAAEVGVAPPAVLNGVCLLATEAASRATQAREVGRRAREAQRAEEGRLAGEAQQARAGQLPGSLGGEVPGSSLSPHVRSESRFEVVDPPAELDGAGPSLCFSQWLEGRRQGSAEQGGASGLLRGSMNEGSETGGSGSHEAMGAAEQGGGAVEIVLAFDGGCRNQGAPDKATRRAGAGALMWVNGDLTWASSVFVGAGEGVTSNVAEWVGCRAALEAAAGAVVGVGFTRQVRSLRVVGDSELVVGQLAGKKQVRQPTFKGHFSASQAALRTLCGGRVEPELISVPRAVNSLADRLANVALDAEADRCWVSGGVDTGCGEWPEWLAGQAVPAVDLGVRGVTLQKWSLRSRGDSVRGAAQRGDTSEGAEGRGQGGAGRVGAGRVAFAFQQGEHGRGGQGARAG